MNHGICLACVLVICASAIAEDMISAEKFKLLPRQEREAWLRKAPPELMSKLSSLHERLTEKEEAGPEAWVGRQYIRLVTERELFGLYGVLTWQDALSRAYWGEQLEAAKRAALPDLEYQATWRMVAEKNELLDRKFQEDLRSLVFLAPGSAARQLDKRAKELCDQVLKRFPPERMSQIPQGELDRLERTARDIFLELKRLPSLSQEQIDAEIEALPIVRSR